jgi:hypothetical protein
MLSAIKVFSAIKSNRPLEPDDTVLFYDLLYKLNDFVYKRSSIRDVLQATYPVNKEDNFEKKSQRHIQKCQAWLDERSLIDQFLATESTTLSTEEALIISGWKHAKWENMLFLKCYPEYAVMQSLSEVNVFYGVRATRKDFTEIFTHKPPLVIKTGLLPFKKSIVWCGFALGTQMDVMERIFMHALGKTQIELCKKAYRLKKIKTHFDNDPYLTYTPPADTYTIPSTMQTKIQIHVQKFNDKYFTQPSLIYYANIQGRYIYCGLGTSPQSSIPIFRLTYKENIDAMGFAIFSPTLNKYDPLEDEFPGADYVDGTLEGAMLAGLETVAQSSKNYIAEE